MRQHAHVTDWRPFILGYEEALRDIERTGLRPLHADSREARACAERAFNRIYITREGISS